MSGSLHGSAPREDAPGRALATADLLEVVSSELGQCAAGLTGLQHLLADQRADVLPSCVVQQIQSLDHITQMTAALSILSRHLAHAVGTGRHVTVAEIDDMPVMQELKNKAVPYRRRETEGDDCDAGTPLWL